MEIRSIKGIDEETWREFKTIAVKNNLKMSLLFRAMVNEFEKKSDDFWKKILKGNKILSDSEAEDMLNLVKELRKEKGFRE